MIVINIFERLLSMASSFGGERRVQSLYVSVGGDKNWCGSYNNSV